MRIDLSIAVCLFIALAVPAAGQTPPVTGAAMGPPVIACASLANLRSVLRAVNDDSAAAIPIISDPKSDLGCNVLDLRAVMGIADEVALNGRAYECLTLQSTSVCQWTVAGSTTPAASGPGPARAAPALRPSEKGRR